jgi:hypothetical protein
MLERTDAITNEVLEPIMFVLAYPTVYCSTEVEVPDDGETQSEDLFVRFEIKAVPFRYLVLLSCSGARWENQILFCWATSSSYSPNK